MSSALLPAASEQLIKGDKIELSKMINTAIRMSIFISGFSFTMLMLEPSYFLNLVSNAYIEAEYALRILVIISMNTALSAIFASLLNASNRTIDVAKIEIVSSVFVIVLTFILIPPLGLEGAALATFIGSACSLILCLVAIKREEKLSISITNLLKPIVPIAVALTVGRAYLVWDSSYIDRNYYSKIAPSNTAKTVFAPHRYSQYYPGIFENYQKLATLWGEIPVIIGEWAEGSQDTTNDYVKELKTQLASGQHIGIGFYAWKIIPIRHVYLTTTIHQTNT